MGVKRGPRDKRAERHRAKRDDRENVPAGRGVADPEARPGQYIALDMFKTSVLYTIV